MTQMKRELPSPLRSAVGKRNRAFRKGLTDSGRQRLQAAALENTPWRYSRGPKTPLGKYRSAQNGRQRQKGPLSIREAREEIRADRELIRFILDHPELGILEAR